MGTVSFEIDPLAEEYPIPSFLVHPLVENAVKYGMKTSSMPLRIKIQAIVRKNELAITVSNSGGWLADDAEGRSRPTGTGTGLKNVRERLENRFPGNYSLTTAEQAGCVIIKISISRNVEVNND